MTSKNNAITVDALSKCYRIGLKEKIHDSLGATLIDLIKSPVTNYRMHRSLYRFDDLKDDARLDDKGVIWALKDVSFEVHQGEAVGIIGRNGAGKSTLLKVLSKITDPTSGRATIEGRISSLLEVGTGFHPDLSGRENVYLNGTILGMRKKEVDQKFDEIVAFSDIEKFIDTPVKRYSSGMKVRLAFSVAAHLEPDILIIDEVLAVGDAGFQKKCLNKMEDVGTKGRTVLFVSHNMSAVTRLCPRAIFMENGRIIDDGPAGSVVHHYMTSESGVTAQRRWPDPQKAPGDKIARLVSVRVKSDTSEVADAVDIRHPVYAEMIFEVMQSGHILLPNFHFYNEEGIHVFTTLEQDPEWRRKTRSAGYYVSTVKVPGNFLAEGMFYITAAMAALNPTKVQFIEKDVVAFQVVDNQEGDSARGDYANAVKGVIRPLLEWRSEYSSSVKALSSKWQ